MLAEKSHTSMKAHPDYADPGDLEGESSFDLSSAGSWVAMSALAFEGAQDQPRLESTERRHFVVSIADTVSAVSPRQAWIESAALEAVDNVIPNSLEGSKAEPTISRHPVEADGNGDEPSWSENFATRFGVRFPTTLAVGDEEDKYSRTLRALDFLDALSAEQRVVARGGMGEPRPIDRARFRRLADTWRKETAGMSVMRTAVMHRSYQEIIGMGPVAIPLLLEELRDRPDHWMWALSALTGENPAEGTQTFRSARASWLRWGQEQGCLSAG